VGEKLRSLSNTILIDSSDDPLYYIDIALGVDRRELLIEAIVSELQRLEAESLTIKDDT